MIIGAIARLGHGGRAHGALRLPAPAPRPTPRPAHHRDRHLGLPPGGRAALLRHPGLPRRQAARPLPADRRGHRAGLPDRRRDDPAVRASSPSAALVMCAALLWYFVNRTKTRPRHAGRLAGPRHRPAHGHQRRPDHRRRVRRRRRPRGRRGRRAGPADTATSTSGWASWPASRRSPPPSSAASATSRAPWSAASSSGVVEAMATQFIPGQFGGRPGRTSGRSCCSSSSWSSDHRASSARGWWTGHEHRTHTRSHGPTSVRRSRTDIDRPAASATSPGRRPSLSSSAPASSAPLPVLVLRRQDPRRPLHLRLPGGAPALRARLGLVGLAPRAVRARSAAPPVARARCGGRASSASASLVFIRGHRARHRLESAA